MFLSVTDAAPLSVEGAALHPIDNILAADLAREVVAIDPWAKLGTRAEDLHAFLVASDAHCHKRLVRRNGTHAGLVVVRSPWLYGPYISLLAVLPAHQGHGLGSAILTSIEHKVRSSDANLWVCASTFNSHAIQFYTHRGFQPVGDLPDLVRPGFTERLFRKRLHR